MNECLISVRAFSGQTQNRALSSLYTNIRCMIGSARTEVAAFYEGVPLGQVYEFVIKDSDIAMIPDGSEITVTSPQNSGILVNSVFVVIAKAQRQRVRGRLVITGVCYLREN